VDRHLPFRRDLARFSISVVVMRASSTRLADLRELVPQLLAALPRAQRGEVTWIDAEQGAWAEALRAPLTAAVSRRENVWLQLTM
jgi:hypothetical protein